MTPASLFVCACILLVVRFEASSRVQSSWQGYREHGDLAYLKTHPLWKSLVELSEWGLTILGIVAVQMLPRLSF